MSRIKQSQSSYKFIVSLGLILFSVFLSGCEVLATQGARQAISSQREIRAFEDQELGPLEREMDDLFTLEIRPRETEIEVLRYQLQTLEEDVLRPLWDAQNDAWAPGGEASEAQLLFQSRYRELELLQRSIEVEQRELDTKMQSLWGAGGHNDPEFQALEDLRYEKQRELDKAYRFGNRPSEDIWNEINELNSAHNWGNTDSQIRAEEINVELSRLYDRYSEIQHSGNGEASLLEERARSAQDELDVLYRHGWDPINQIYDEIEALEREQSGRLSTANNDASIKEYIAQLERMKADYVVSRDAELASLYAALAAVGAESSINDTATGPAFETTARISELELLITDLEAHSAVLLASVYSEIDALTVLIDEKNAAYDQLIADTKDEFETLSDSLLAQAVAVGIELDALIAIGGDDVAAQTLILQAKKDLLLAQEETEDAATDEVVRQLKNDRDAAVDELQSARQVFEAEASSGLTDANDSQVATYQAELYDLLSNSSGDDGTVVTISNTVSSADIQANIDATEAYWNGLMGDADIEILELQSQLNSTAVDDGANARIKNLLLQAGELELELNARIVNFEATVNELYRQANNANSGDSAALTEVQLLIDELNGKLETIWRQESSNGLEILRRVQALELKARTLDEEFKQRTRALEEELWTLDDQLSVYYRDQETANRLMQVEYETEMALFQQRRIELDERRWAIELEERTVYEAIEAKNAAAMEEINRLEDGQFADMKVRIRKLELELRGFYATQREIEIRMDDAWRVVEEKQRALEDNVLDLLEAAAGAGVDAESGVGPVDDAITIDGANNPESDLPELDTSDTASDSVN